MKNVKSYDQPIVSSSATGGHRPVQEAKPGKEGTPGNPSVWEEPRKVWPSPA